jgi:hypothetical protein
LADARLLDATANESPPRHKLLEVPLSHFTRT